MVLFTGLGSSRWTLDRNMTAINSCTTEWKLPLVIHIFHFVFKFAFTLMHVFRNAFLPEVNNY